MFYSPSDGQSGNTYDPSIFGGDATPSQPTTPASPAAPTGTPTFTPSASTAATQASQSGNWNQGPWDAPRIAAYFKSRGVTPSPGSIDYWTQKWNEFGQKDPAYFLQRLSQADEFGGGGGMGSGLFTTPFTPPTPGALPEMPKFGGVTMADLTQDPSYQWRIGQGQQALEQSAAARGLLNTGGTLKDLLNYGQNAASQEFGNVWGRKMAEYQPVYNAWQTIFGNTQRNNELDWTHAYDKWVQDWNINKDTFNRQYSTATA